MNNKDRNQSNDASNEQLGDPSARPNSLKNRIKQRAMAMDCDDKNEVHISSVLAAASALADLGNSGSTPPSTPENPAGASDMKLSLEQMMMANAGNSSRGLPREFEQDVPMTFPQKLMEILSNSQLTDIVTWLPNGKGFIILQKRRFATEVMPMYFKHSKFTSFTRKLNRWGFTRVTRGPESGAYYHKFFQRGQHNLCMQMHCQSKVASKDSASMKESPALTPMKSPGVSSKMSSLKLTESPSPASGNAQASFSTSNPNIFAPDLTRRDEAEAPSSSLLALAADSQGSLSGFKRPFTFGSQQNQMHDEQTLRLLNSHQELLRQQMTNSQRVFGQNAFQLSRLDPSFQQSRSFGYDKAIGMNISSSRNHPFVIQSAMNALRRTENSPQPQTNDQTAMTTLRRQEHVLHPHSSDLTPMTAFQRQEQMKMTQPPMTDKAYLEMLRAKGQSKQSSGFVSALESSLGTPAETSRMIRQAMQAQMRKFEERNRKDFEEKHRKEFEELNRKEVNAPSSVSEAKPSAVKSNFGMTQSQVATLRQDLAKKKEARAQAKTPQDLYPKAVRRASAA